MTTASGDRFGHPKGLVLLFFVEMWERFSYYGMRALLILYLVNALRWPVADAANLYGAYTGLVWIAPLLGGYLADRVLGTQRSLVIGGVLIALGHFSLALGSTATFYLGLGLVILGTGFFKPNVSTLVGQLYAPDDPRRDSGFTIFFMGINLGAFIAPLVCGYLGQRVGWHYGFGAAGVGMVLGLALYLWGRDRYLPAVGLAPARRAPSSDRASIRGNDDGRRVLAVLIVVVVVIAFWVCYEQGGSSLNLFADRHVERTVETGLGGFEVPASWFQAINPLAIIVFAPLFAITWQWLGRRGREPSAPAKMVIGFGFLAAAYAVMALAGRLSETGMLVSALWIVAADLFRTWGELAVSPVGLSYVSRVAPARFGSRLMGVWFVAQGIGSMGAGWLAGQFGTRATGAFYAQFTLIAVGAGIVLALAVPLLKRLASATPPLTTAPEPAQ